MANITLGGSISSAGTYILGVSDIVNSNSNKILDVSEYTNQVINITGALTAQRNIQAPLVSGFTFIVSNNTSGGYPIQFIGPTGTGVIILNGEKTIVSCDGANYNAISGTSSFIAGGDLSGSNISQTVTQARGLKTSTTTVSLSSATEPSFGQVLTALSPTSANWQTPVAIASAAIFDGGNPENIISSRVTYPSPIDNTKNGIVNLGSKSTGVTTGVTGNYSTISGGDTNQISDDYSVISGGRNNTITAAVAVISGGQFNEANGVTSTITGGYNNIIDSFAAYSSINGGNTNHANNLFSSINGGHSNIADGVGSTINGGGHNTSGGDYSISEGIYTNSNKYGQYSHSSSTIDTTRGHSQYSRVVYSAISVAGATAYFTDTSAGTGSNYVFETDKKYLLHISIIAKGTGFATAAFINDLVVSDVAGTSTISYGPITALTYNPASYTIAFGIVSGNQLQISIYGAVYDTIRAVATIEATEVY